MIKKMYIDHSYTVFKYKPPPPPQSQQIKVVGLQIFTFIFKQGSQIHSNDALLRFINAKKQPFFEAFLNFVGLYVAKENKLYP